ncbi:MAG: hypothetical protein ABS81_04400 [Pseudonocardia sp. SCN 72-86]|nr:MAG: hypothetical protein ABS81_04400 [Pseudonocardia sp. SCN 72-86]
MRVATLASLWWPGDHRAGDLLSDNALLQAMVRVEQAWLDSLVAAGVAPQDAAADLRPASAVVDVREVAIAAETTGTPVMALVDALRAQAAASTAMWLHRGLTSQDVLDTAIVLCAEDAVSAIRTSIATQVCLLGDLVRAHRSTPAVARTLTRPALPTTFGARVAGWLHTVLDADDALAGIARPVQLGGAAGTLAALVEMAGPRVADVRSRFAAGLGLGVTSPPPTRRTWVTRIGDGVATANDAWGRIARDVLELGRANEVADGSAGGSSSMPQKENPALAVLVRRAALAAPAAASPLHLAAAEQVDERADGAWHVEWQTLALLLRRTVVAASQIAEMLERLVVRPEIMAENLLKLGDTLLGEQRVMATIAGRDPAADYLGVTDELIDDALARAMTRVLGAGIR